MTRYKLSSPESRINLLRGYLEAYQIDLADAEKNGWDIIAVKARENIRSVKASIKILEKLILTPNIIIMTPETHQKELSALFADQTVTTSPTDEPNVVKAVINREVSRPELGHCFSLGMCGVKRSGTGVSVKFDLNKAHLNFQ